MDPLTQLHYFHFTFFFYIREIWNILINPITRVLEGFSFPLGTFSFILASVRGTKKIPPFKYLSSFQQGQKVSISSSLEQPPLDVRGVPKDGA